MPIVPLSEILSWPASKRLRANAKLSLFDDSSVRWHIIAELLKHKPDALAAIDSLGQMTQPVSQETMQPIYDNLFAASAGECLNKLVGIVDGAVLRRAAFRDRTVILWLLHDLRIRARIAAERIKEERALRREVAENEIWRLDRSHARLQRITLLVDEVEPAFNRLDDRMRPKPSVFSSIREERDYYDQFRSGRPMWPGILGVDWRVGDTTEASNALGNRSAWGAFGIVARAFIGRRHDRDFASLAGAAVGSTVTAREFERCCETFLAQRGPPPEQKAD